MEVALQNTYDIELQPVFKPLQVIDAGNLAANCGSDWWSR